jgi:hypothetical protein
MKIAGRRLLSASMASLVASVRAPRRSSFRPGFGRFPMMDFLEALGIPVAHAYICSVYVCRRGSILPTLTIPPTPSLGRLATTLLPSLLYLLPSPLSIAPLSSSNTPTTNSYGPFLIDLPS